MFGTWLSLFLSCILSCAFKRICGNFMICWFIAWREGLSECLVSYVEEVEDLWRYLHTVFNGSLKKNEFSRFCHKPNKAKERVIMAFGTHSVIFCLWSNPHVYFKSKLLDSPCKKYYVLTTQQLASYQQERSGCPLGKWLCSLHPPPHSTWSDGTLCMGLKLPKDQPWCSTLEAVGEQWHLWWWHCMTSYI